MTYLKFTEIHDTGKTKVWSVTNTNDESRLGVVRWYGPWRKYVLMAADAIWSADCLADISKFIDEKMIERKNNL